jgi:hypothetical protein
MTSLCNLGTCGARHSLQLWAFQQLAARDLASGDVRFSAIALVSDALSALGNAWFENIAGRAFQGAQFASRVTAADTMVAAG